MSTVSSCAEPASGDGSTGSGVSGASAKANPAVVMAGTLSPPSDAITPEVLAMAAGAFAETFERWANRKALEAGASIPRLRLLYSVHCHGPQKMADLAGELSVTPRNVTALVDSLEAEGMVRRLAHSTDRRVTLVELTCNSDRVEAQFKEYQAAIASLFAGLGAEDKGNLLRLLESLRERMRADSTYWHAGEVAPDA